MDFLGIRTQRAVEAFSLGLEADLYVFGFRPVFDPGAELVKSGAGHGIVAAEAVAKAGDLVVAVEVVDVGGFGGDRVVVLVGALVGD